MCLMREPIALISELDAERSKFFAVALVVGFENHTEFVFADESEKIQKLNKAIEHDGEPVGMLGVVQIPGNCTIYTRVLKEHVQDEWVIPYLDRLTEMFKTLLRLEIAEKKSGWVN